MSEKKRILESIRLRMRRDNLTYAQLAKKSKVSEVSVKRYFSEERLSLDTLDSICTALGASLEELLNDFKNSAKEEKTSFTEEQEQALANDEFLFVLFFIVARGYSYQSIMKKLHNKRPAEVIKGLRDLELLRLIEFRSEQNLRPLVSSNAGIKPGGALWKKYSSIAANNFFDCLFSQKDEYFSLSLGYLTEASEKQLRTKFEKIEVEIDTLLSLHKDPKKSNEKVKFFWIANSYRPMTSSILETLATKSKLLPKAEK